MNRKFGEVIGCKVNIQKLIMLIYTINEQLGIEI